MTSRIEQKLEFSKEYYIDLLRWLKSKGTKVIYPKRIICSRYFDTVNLDMYSDVLEGIIPRKKIRIRTYNSREFKKGNFPYKLEVKITKEHERFKSCRNIYNYEKIIKQGYYDKHYGTCFAKVDISYKREYFLIDEIRITIDSEINYKSISNKVSKHKKEKIDNSFVLEIKADISKSLTVLSNKFDFPRTRFSKYQKAIESIFN